MKFWVKIDYMHNMEFGICTQLCNKLNPISNWTSEEGEWFYGMLGCSIVSMWAMINSWSTSGYICLKIPASI